MYTKKIILAVIAMIFITGCKERIADYYFAKAVECDSCKDYKCAIKNYSYAIKLEKKLDNKSRLYFFRGHSYYTIRKYESALADFNTALSIDDKNVDAYFWRGQIYNLQQKFELAINDFNTIININDSRYDYYYWRASVYYRWGKYDFALADYNLVIKLDSTCAGCYYVRGETYQKINLPDSALADFEKAAYLGNEKAIKELKKYEKER